MVQAFNNSSKHADSSVLKSAKLELKVRRHQFLDHHIWCCDCCCHSHSRKILQSHIPYSLKRYNSTHIALDMNHACFFIAHAPFNTYMTINVALPLCIIRSDDFGCDDRACSRGQLIVLTALRSLAHNWRGPRHLSYPRFTAIRHDTPITTLYPRQ